MIHELKGEARAISRLSTKHGMSSNQQQDATFQ
jgi:hypothetical protein